MTKKELHWSLWVVSISPLPLYGFRRVPKRLGLRAAVRKVYFGDMSGAPEQPTPRGSLGFAGIFRLDATFE